MATPESDQKSTRVPVPEQSFYHYYVSVAGAGDGANDDETFGKKLEELIAKIEEFGKSVLGQVTDISELSKKLPSTHSSSETDIPEGAPPAALEQLDKTIAEKAGAGILGGGGRKHANELNSVNVSKLGNMAADIMKSVRKAQEYKKLLDVTIQETSNINNMDPKLYANYQEVKELATRYSKMMDENISSIYNAVRPAVEDLEKIKLDEDLDIVLNDLKQDEKATASSIKTKLHIISELADTVSRAKEIYDKLKVAKVEGNKTADQIDSGKHELSKLLPDINGDKVVEMIREIQKIEGKQGTTTLCFIHCQCRARRSRLARSRHAGTPHQTRYGDRNRCNA